MNKEVYDVLVDILDFCQGHNGFSSPRDVIVYIGRKYKTVRCKEILEIAEKSGLPLKEFKDGYELRYGDGTNDVFVEEAETGRYGGEGFMLGVEDINTGLVMSVDEALAIIKRKRGTL